VPEWRRGPVRHCLAALVRQRVFQIACGYEDQNDADTLRSDPLLKLVCGRRPESEAELASQPTLSRLENAVDRHACARLAHALLAIYLQAREQDGRPPHIVLVQLDTLRLRLLKVGGRVRELATHVRLHLASSHPSQPLWDLLAASCRLRE
jgi:hypothetical protein